MADPSGCVFCKIAAGTIPASLVLQNDQVVAFLDIGPLAPGHTLLIPRTHVEHLTDLPPDAASALAAELPRLGRAVLQATGAAGFNVLINQGGVAGQVVPHVHVHIIPRKEGDSLGYRWNAGTYATGQAEKLVAAIQRALNA